MVKFILLFYICGKALHTRSIPCTPYSNSDLFTIQKRRRRKKSGKWAFLNALADMTNLYLFDKRIYQISATYWIVTFSFAGAEVYYFGENVTSYGDIFKLLLFVEKNTKMSGIRMGNHKKQDKNLFRPKTSKNIN